MNSQGRLAERSNSVATDMFLSESFLDKRELEAANPGVKRKESKIPVGDGKPWSPIMQDNKTTPVAAMLLPNQVGNLPSPLPQHYPPLSPSKMGQISESPRGGTVLAPIDSARTLDDGDNNNNMMNSTAASTPGSTTGAPKASPSSSSSAGEKAGAAGGGGGGGGGGGTSGDAGEAKSAAGGETTNAVARPRLSSGPIDYAANPCQFVGQEGPVDVALSILVKELSGIDLNSGTFRISMGMIVRWNDPRMVGWADSKVPDDLWTPHVMMPTAVDLDSDVYPGSKTVVVENKDEGLLKYQRNVQCCFSTHYDLKKFPFDEHLVGLRFNGSKLRDGRTATSKDQVLHAGVSTKVIRGPKRDAPFILWSAKLADLIPEYELVGIAYSA